MTETKSPKSSSGGLILGSQEPSARVCPDYAKTDGHDAVNILASGGFVLDPWQESVMCDWMARNEFGRWSCPTCGLSVPRQNGKTALVAGRVEAGMILFNEQIIYTAHLQKTATETFEEIAGFFDTPKMRKYLKDIKTALGREQVILKRGARVKFLARTRNGGRGQHGDLWLVDEAQCLDDDGQASFLPAISASRNPQAIYIGTPPDLNEHGDVFRSIRAEALDGKTTRTSWTEFSVNEIGDVHDIARWAASNPALGRRIQLSTVEGEVEQMSEDTFARERLGWWSPIATRDYAIAANRFEALAVDSAPTSGRTAYGVKFAPDGSEVSLAAARIDGDAVYVEQIRREPMALGLGWLAEWIASRKSAGCCCVIDGKSGAQALVDKLGTMPVNYIVTPSASQVIAACTAMVDRVNEGTLEWFRPQADLLDSAVTSTRRKIGSTGGWGFGGENPIPIEAASLALWGVLNSKRNPERKQRIG